MHHELPAHQLAQLPQFQIQPTEVIAEQHGTKTSRHLQAGQTGNQFYCLVPKATGGRYIISDAGLLGTCMFTSLKLFWFPPGGLRDERGALA